MGVKGEKMENKITEGFFASCRKLARYTHLTNGIVLLLRKRSMNRPLSWVGHQLVSLVLLPLMWGEALVVFVARIFGTILYGGLRGRRVGIKSIAPYARSETFEESEDFSMFV